ncbi:hypothetical protein K1719_009019 [Acacia pycnantha]|nr:hypothetical protein K1719_009019 [Acacia pycnantha]
MAALATSSQVLQKKYDVFISFRGSDIRPTFLSHLKKQLQQEEIDVYVDERLERGDKISTALLEAIESSMIALVIFSKDYASSWWCLEELVKIMECKRVNDQVVIPVFYNVDPSHVRHQEGSYGDAFAQHEQKYNHDLMKLWKSVLENTANLSGHHSSNYFAESDLIDDIIKNVSKKLEDKDIDEPKDQLIGFQKDMTTIESFMKVDSEEVRVIGIWGKGGIGKTTLAQVVFDKFSPRYNSSCFVSNVREESKRIGLTGLLEKILSVLLNNENLTYKRRPNTQRRLSRRKAFLVLDDVDTSGQLHYLIEENLSLGPNSKIIITSRDKHVLISGGVHEVHEMKELCMEESLQLFCWYAFKKDHPKIGYKKLSMQAIEYAGGLPLALKVLGSYLNSRDTKTWDSALKKLRKHPNSEIYNVLRVSYDGLDILEKRIFLDIAFFLWGKKKELIINVLDACDDLYADCGIDGLINKALITISSDNIVGIHDLLREMAEEIVREESRKHPERRSRLNNSKEIQDILKNSMGTDAIEGIILEFDELSEDHLSLSANAFKNLSNLRILKIQHCDPIGGRRLYFPNGHLNFPNGLDSLSDKLSYIYWEQCSLASLPMGFCAEKLVEIHMPNSGVAKLWDDAKNLMNLKTINLSSCCNLVELPDLSMAQNLEIMELDYCSMLCSIHPSILSLPKLSYLDLTGCWKLKSLHGDKHMKSLKYLMLKGCINLVEFFLSSEELRRLILDGTGLKTLKLPIGQFNKLDELCLGGSLKSFQINELSCLTSLKKFSLSKFRGQIIWKSNLLTLFDVWRSLDELHLTHCAVYEIPDNISAMSLLRTLSLRGCQVEGLPNSIKHLSELKELDLGYCQQLRSLPELPPSITHFYVDGCTSLETIDFKVMRTIYNNYSGEVKVCYPGSTIPKGFKYSRTAERFITIELAPSSSDHLLGFASCCVLAKWDVMYINTFIWRKLHLEDEEIYCEDEKKFPNLGKWNGCNVYLWYDPMESILKETQRSFDGGTTYKFTCEFFVGDCFRNCVVECDHHWINECGIWPIYASDLQEEVVQQMELKLENRTTKRKRNSFTFFMGNFCAIPFII